MSATLCDPGEPCGTEDTCLAPACSRPAGPGWHWSPPHHLVGADLGLRCIMCGGHTSLTPPCRPGEWLQWIVPAPLAERQVDGMGAE